MITIYTIQLSLLRQFVENHGKVYDTTVKTGAESISGILAPTWALVGGYKRSVDPGNKKWRRYKPISWEEYEVAYTDLIRDRFKSHYSRFHQWVMDTAQQGRVYPIAIGCYCSANDPCHRHLLIDRVFPGLFAHFGIEWQYAGEYRQNEQTAPTPDVWSGNVPKHLWTADSGPESPDFGTGKFTPEQIRAQARSMYEFLLKWYGDSPTPEQQRKLNFWLKESKPIPW